MLLKPKHYGMGTGYTPELVLESAKSALNLITPIYIQAGGRDLGEYSNSPKELQSIISSVDVMTDEELRKSFYRISKIRNFFAYELAKK